MAKVISKLLLLLISNRYKAERSPVVEHLSFWRGIKNILCFVYNYCFSTLTYTSLQAGQRRKRRKSSV